MAQAWVHDEGPLTVFVDGYRSLLGRRGHSVRSVRVHASLMGWLNRWLAAGGVSVEELTRDRAESFLADQRAAGRRRVPTMRMLAPLFEYLQDLSVLPPERPPEATALDDLLDQYGRYLIGDRGLAPLTVVRYQRMARRFLAGRAAGRPSGELVEGLDADEVHVYLLQCRSRLVLESAKREAADLRSLLRFLYLRGLTGTDLGTAMPPVAGWKDARLPETLTRQQVAALLAGCDRSKPAGLRDFAMLCLLGRLGLRSGEVAALRLDDIDWRAGELLVRGKARREDRLPLTVEVGEALVGYLHDGRPVSSCPNVILTCYAPFRPIHPSSITRVVYRACRRAGLALVGGHRLRHALATEMLRGGGDLVEIGQVLRHRDLATTAVYAKLDRAALRAVAGPWPISGPVVSR